MRIVAFVIMLMLGCKQPGKSTVNQIKNGDSYKCILVEPKTDAVHCGIIKVAVAMKFRLEDGNENLVVLVPCPEMHGRNFFTKGQRYTIKLTSDTAAFTGFTIINQYTRSKIPTYYALEIVKAEFN